ncbi:MAG: DUF3299 domain-containing protein [Acidobacteriota bacterium]
MLHRRSTRAMLGLVASLVVSSCGGGPNDPAAVEQPSSERPSDEAGDQPSEEAGPSPRSQSPAIPELQPDPVDVEGAVRPLRLRVIPEFGYENEAGELVLDVMERDYVYLTLLIEDAEGHPVQGLLPTVTPEGDSRFIPLNGEDAVSNKFGGYAFGIQGGSMGEERVEIVADKAVESVILNVISLRAAGYGWLEDVEGVLSWTQLFKAEIEWGEEQLFATFPDEVLAENGQTVKLAGFMLPLETTRKQKHFVLASNPPGCFFHIPGGPAGAVEVFAKEPLEVTWEPVLLEGRFEAQETSEMGVLYRLHEARSAGPVPRPPEP